MKNIAKKKFKKYVDSLFVYVKNHTVYAKIKKLRPIWRIFILCFCILWFILATLLFPPLPFGNFILVLGLVAFFPIDKVRSKLYYIVNKTRLKWFYAKWLKGKYTVKKKYTKTKQSRVKSRSKS